MLYYISGCIIESNVSLPGVSSGICGEPRLHFSLQSPDEWEVLDTESVHTVQTGIAPWLKICKAKPGYLLEFPDLAKFHLIANKVRCYPGPGTVLDTSIHLFLNQVLPLILSTRGNLVLHSSAVAIGERAAAFVGSTGLGKSTLAASLAANGVKFVSDDCLVIDPTGSKVIPSYPTIRLWPKTMAAMKCFGEDRGPVASYTRKRRLSVEPEADFDHTPVPLQRMFLLDTQIVSRVVITPVSPKEALLELLKCSFILDPRSSDQLSTQFRLAAHLANQGLAFRLSYPRDLSYLPNVREKIIEHVMAGQPKVTSGPIEMNSALLRRS